MNETLAVKLNRDTKKDDLIVIAGAGGFIAGALTRYFTNRVSPVSVRSIKKRYRIGTSTYRALKPCLDLSEKENAIRAVEGAVEVYNLAADMGGMGFIERFAFNACAVS